ncbi:hypothetical protein QA612_00305 [Evansella sp. AB-P1]|nr:hypothetical protein [Evansella sp. AB-P1]MDG5785911.1 hypothetical protein [Evansella sp. AB-P1]
MEVDSDPLSEQQYLSQKENEKNSNNSRQMNDWWFSFSLPCSCRHIG